MCKNSDTRYLDTVEVRDSSSLRPTTPAPETQDLSKPDKVPSGSANTGTDGETGSLQGPAGSGNSLACCETSACSSWTLLKELRQILEALGGESICDVARYRMRRAMEAERSADAMAVYLAERTNELRRILDVLQKAGVLRNDNIARCNGVITLLPAVLAAKEKTVIEIAGPRPENGQVTS